MEIDLKSLPFPSISVLPIFDYYLVSVISIIGDFQASHV